MIRFLSLLLAVFLALAAPAFAERVVEVRNVHVEQAGQNGRDGAIAEATKQAALGVWRQLGKTGDLPPLTPAQIQSLASYVDIANEQVQPGYYAATFTVGIRAQVLSRLTGVEVPAESAEAASTVGSALPQSTAYTATADPRDWVLVIPVRLVLGQAPQLWDDAGDWHKVWFSAAAGGRSLVVSTGDAEDRALLTPDVMQKSGDDLARVLLVLGKKYKAPSVALIRLETDGPQIGPASTLGVDVSLVAHEQEDLREKQTRVYVAADLVPSAFVLARQQALVLLSDLSGDDASMAATAEASGFVPRATSVAPVSTLPPPPVPAVDNTTLPVRLPLKSPADLASYRSKIASITGAQFELRALGRHYAEGLITYRGPRDVLMRELAAKGLGQAAP